MKIALSIYEYPPHIVGGLGTYGQYIVPEIAKAGNDVTVVSLDYQGNPATESKQGNVEVHRPRILNAWDFLPFMIQDELGWWGQFFNDFFVYNMAAANHVVNDLIRGRGREFDLIVAHDWLSAMSGLIMKRETGLPTVFHIHSAEWGRRADGGSPFVLKLERAMADRADAIVTVSHAMRDDLIAHGWNAEKIHAVWNGIDPDVYDPAKVDQGMVDNIRQRYNCGPDDQLLLYVGRLTWVKGVVEMVRGMPEVLRQNPNAHLVILGRGEQEGEIAGLVSGLGLSDHVATRFDWVGEDERIGHYAASDLCVFPSIYEPFGIVSLEAMSMAKPVVVGARGVVGFREQVVPEGPEQNGLHVNGANPADIAWGISTALSNLAQLPAWGENGRRRVLRQFTWRASAEATLEVYSGALQKAGAGSVG